MMWVWICLGVLFAIELYIAKDICNVYQRLLNDEKALILGIILSKPSESIASYYIMIDSFDGVSQDTFDELKSLVNEAKAGTKRWKDVTDFAYLHGIKLMLETQETEDK